MKSAEGYLLQEPNGSDEGPWPAAPGIEAPAPKTHEADPALATTISAAEEALEAALAEVDQAQEELSAMEEMHDRLRGRVQQASAEADALISTVSDSYAREQMRLEAELRSVHERVSDLERIRETWLGRGVPDGPISQGEPDPMRFTVDPDPAPEPEPASAPVVAAIPTVFATPEDKAGDREASQRGAVAPAPTEAVKARPATDQNLEGEDGAYEDRWYQVLRQDSLGADPA